MQETIDLLIKNAELYKKADSQLEQACGETKDPIACTVFARKGIHLEHLPQEAHNAAFYLNEVTRLCGILVQNYHMDSDAVRAIWFPILKCLLKYIIKNNHKLIFSQNRQKT